MTSRGNKPILILGSYREWQKPKVCNQPNSKHIKQQTNRLNITMRLWETLIAENKDLLILTDDNIDSSPHSSHNRRYNINQLYNILKNTMNQLNIVQCNNKFTRIISHQSPSCIDKLYTNVSHKISNIQTISNIDSDHNYITAIYNSKESIYSPKYLIKRVILIWKLGLETWLLYRIYALMHLKRKISLFLTILNILWLQPNIW